MIVGFLVSTIQFGKGYIIVFTSNLLGSIYDYSPLIGIHNFEIAYIVKHTDRDCLLQATDLLLASLFQISIPSQVVQRSLFSLSAFHISPDCVWLLLFGGTPSWNMDQLDTQQQRISQTVILEFSEFNERTCKTIH